MKVGFIGTGLMGTRMANCLIEAGHELVVNDLYRESATQLIDKGSVWADSPRATAEQSEVIILSLPGPEEVQAVVMDPEHGVLSGIRPGSCLIDTSSNSPGLFRKIAAACREKAAEALDCPVTGRAPDMTVMVGGDPKAYERVLPLLQSMSRGVYYMGEAGQGMVAKGINQFLLHAKFLLAGEAMLLGVKAGLPLRTLADFLESGVGAGRGLPFDVFEKHVFPGQFERIPGGNGNVYRWVKDVGCAQEVAWDTNTPTPMLTITEDILKRAIARGIGEEVNFADIKILEEWAGAELRTEAKEG